ncbi:MAG: hypothetical protein IKI65_03860 [Firmicutes bacterium]|nr:hypothetical protein [Bacillota bacterium]
MLTFRSTVTSAGLRRNTNLWFDTEKTDDEFLRAMDAEMYKDKQHYKSLQKQAGR